jgi:2,4-dienoyl-CoA reductase-like NADH-dependent reductase (Old Yellow Enzyme family)
LPWEGGRNIPLSEGGWETVAPSANPYELSDSTPIELNNEMLPHVLNAFVSTAKRAERLGVDIIELHSAHGYLLHQFLSPLSNSRTDEYGGSLENRMRFPLEVFKAMRKAVSATIPIGVRISATDWVEGGWDIEQSIEFCRALSKLDCAFIDVSSGGLSPKQKISLESGYQVPFAERIRQETGLPTIAVGLITEYEHAEEIIRKGQADMVALARGILYDPRWPWHAAAKLGSHVEAPNQYLRCQPRGLNTLFS